MNLSHFTLGGRAGVALPPGDQASAEGRRHVPSGRCGGCSRHSGPAACRIRRLARRKGHSRERVFARLLRRGHISAVVPGGRHRMQRQNPGIRQSWPAANREELLIDLMRYRYDAPVNVMEALFVHLMIWGREHGYQRFMLGMAPLSGVEGSPVASLWNRLGAFVTNMAVPSTTSGCAPPGKSSTRPGSRTRWPIQAA